MSASPRYNKRDLFARMRYGKAADCCKCGIHLPARTPLAVYQGSFWCLECAFPIAQVVVPSEAPSAESRRKRRPGQGPGYEIDHAALSYGYTDPILAVEVLVDAMAREGWDRETLCRRCLYWQPKDGEGTRPWRPGATSPIESCTGCVYSALDEVRAAPSHRGFGRRQVLELRVV